MGVAMHHDGQFVFRNADGKVIPEGPIWRPGDHGEVADGEKDGFHAPRDALLAWMRERDHREGDVPMERPDAEDSPRGGWDMHEETDPPQGGGSRTNGAINPPQGGSSRPRAQNDEIREPVALYGA